MGGLLEVADVTSPQGSWASGYQIDSIGCALKSYTSDICVPSRSLLSGAEGGAAEALNANIFSVLVSLPGRAMCSSGEEGNIVRAALDAETEKAAGQALWGLTGNTEVSLESVSVTPVTAGASSVASVGAALVEYWKRATGVSYADTVIHLGVGVLLELFGQIEGSLLKNLDIKVATSPGYPANGIAITGPIRIRLSDDQILSSVSPNDNAALSEANRLAAIEFDPCIAVRVA